MLKTHDQVKRMFGLAAGPAHRTGQNPKTLLEDLAHEVSNGEVERISLLTFNQANAIIRRLGGDAVAAQPATPRRTINYHRKKNGVVQIATAEQITLLTRLAAGRGITDAGLKNLCMRMIKRPAPRTTIEANKIIEALKAMNARDRRTGANHNKEAA